MRANQMTSSSDQKTSSPAPLVSVSITTYNLEKWLPRTLDSVLMQQIDFPIEIVISDDASRDATLQIAHSYRERHPDMIRILERSKNVGVLRNTYETLEACRGKYVAFLDGDDCWTDPLKLSLQVPLLEADPTLSVCGHFARWVTPTGEVVRERYPLIPAGRYGIEEIILHNFLPTTSTIFRNGIHRKLPSWYFEIEALSDWPIWILAAQTGDILLLDRIMSDYTLAPGSAFMSKGDLFWYNSDAKFYERVESILPPKYHRLARSEAGKRYEAIAYALRKKGDFSGSRQAAIKAFRAPSLLDNGGSKTKSLLAATLRELEWKLKGKPAI